MRKIYYKILGIGVVSAFILLLGAVVVINRTIERNLAASEHRTGDIQSAEDIVQIARLNNTVDSSSHLSENDLSSYTIEAQMSGTRFYNQRQWDSSTYRLTAKDNLIGDMKEAGVFKRAKTSTAQFEGQLERIDQRIQEFEQRKIIAPGDSNVEKKLQDLYMMKSSMNVLEDRFTNIRTKK